MILKCSFYHHSLPFLLFLMTTVPIIYAFERLTEVAEAVGDFIVACQTRAIDSGHEPRFKVALSGGSLLHVLNEGLLKRKDVLWPQWDIYFADERLVNPESSESNSGQAHQLIFSHLDLNNRPNVYPIDFKYLDNPQECADQYETTLIRGFASKDSVRLPQFDLVLLGCAPDGHVASLFPTSPALREEYAWCVPVSNAPHGPENRVTLTLPVLCHAKQVAFVVEGSTKAPVLSTIMERPDKGLPASIINEKAAGRIAWFVDQDAVADVIGITKKRYKFSATNAVINSSTT